MATLRRIALVTLLLAGLASLAAAQGGGQLCVRAFEDRNGNGRLDAGEPLLTRGVGVNLLDSSGVTIASSLLDTAPTAAQGVVCFQFLPPGQYSVVITSADYAATTPDTITTTIADGGLPTVVEFGAQPFVVPTPQAGASGAPDAGLDLSRVVISGVAALLVIAGMLVMGVMVYWLAFARRPAHAHADPRRTTGSISAVRDTSEVRRARDTGQSRRVHDQDDDPF